MNGSPAPRRGSARPRAGRWRCWLVRRSRCPSYPVDGPQGADTVSVGPSLHLLRRGLGAPGPVLDAAEGRVRGLGVAALRTFLQERVRAGIAAAEVPHSTSLISEDSVTIGTSTT